MVDALRRAHAMLRPNGQVVDLHPSVAPACVEVAGHPVGYIDAEETRLRHAAAGTALAAAIDQGLLAIEATIDFTFYTYGDTIEELRDHVAEAWRVARIDDDTVDRARAALRDAPDVRPRIRETIHATRLRRVAPDAR